MDDVDGLTAVDALPVASTSCMVRVRVPFMAIRLHEIGFDFKSITA